MVKFLIKTIISYYLLYIHSFFWEGKIWSGVFYLLILFVLFIRTTIVLIKKNKTNILFTILDDNLTFFKNDITRYTIIILHGFLITKDIIIIKRIITFYMHTIKILRLDDGLEINMSDF